jgi:hypothetical protein
MISGDSRADATGRVIALPWHFGSWLCFSIEPGPHPMVYQGLDFIM